MKAVITITDNPDGTSCNVVVDIDPPLRHLKEGERPSPARLALNAAFAAIKREATQIGATEYISRS